MLKIGFKKTVLAAYAALLLLSWVFQVLFPLEIEKQEGQSEIVVQALTEGPDDELEEIKIRYLDTKVSERDFRPVLLLLHGSPMASSSFEPLMEFLSDFRLIIPDLPGFGRSQRDLRSYSIESHAIAMEAFLAALSVDQVHVVGYSMGGGVALEMLAASEKRIQSLSLLSSIGVQEYELLGDYSLNHSVHAIQLAVLKIAETFVPHFGYADQFIINSRYARNFYDSDQRPLKSIIRSYEGPALILHGVDDRLVPLEAAQEHARLLPQAEFKTYDGLGHVFLMTDPTLVSAQIEHFVTNVESNQSDLIRGDQLVVGEPIERKNSDALIAILLAIATFGSEDLACIGAGLLAAKGGISLLYAVFGTFLGIFIGDFFIFLGGRIFGTAALQIPPFKWMLDAKKLEKGGQWFQKRGILLVIATRFLPGSRVPTYFSAGVVKANPFTFAFALFIAAGVWTPILVGLSYYFGGSFVALFEDRGGSFLISAVAIVVLFSVFLRIGMKCLTWKGRRLLYSKYQRMIRWEFWPTWALYPPVILYIGWLMVRHRSITLCTALNPCMPSSGLVFESKSQILTHLEASGSPVGRFAVLELESSEASKMAAIERFFEKYQLTYPIVLKPDVGQRGQGVEIVRSEEDAKAFFSVQVEDTIVQEFIDGSEYGVFYYRIPGEKNGRIMSITDKRFTFVNGDGVSTLETLILSDSRAVCMAAYFLGKFENRLESIPRKNETVVLADLGTHCKGALFLDGESLITPELEKSVDAFSSRIDGFYFGRFDVRAPSQEHLKRGEGLKLIELNGLTSESTNMYDPKHGLFFAYRTLMNQWKLIFQISAENKRRGQRPDSLRETVSLILGYISGKTAKELLKAR